jgi:UrcA family protein
MYADLDLSTADGAQALLRRIDLAAKCACGVEPSHSPLEPRAVAYFRDCVDASVDAAVARVGSPTLASIHDDIKSTTGVTLAAR